ncbi:lipopolysaccharide biosynthesis protein [Rhodanobacter denitrificans]|uniref:Lipopolysaccharide biosynthesis protein n=1 Tax=Rhodanobacter denitrificans TaxID=666685 RepID=A0A368KEG7_9GAMM|nr:lipopolysaccharide biosynthesis protein [Rhodanobacter denitrificans]
MSLSFIQTFISLVFTFGGVVIVSHLLTPAEIGIYSIAAGLVALIQMLRDFGVSEFLIQEEKLDNQKIRTVFTINLLIAWSLGLALFAFSGAAGRFYGNSGVSDVLQVVSIVFVLLPFGAISQTLMKRELEFGKLLRIRLSENVIRSCTTVGLAYAGFSYMSMAWSSVVGIVVMVAGCAVWGWQYRVTGLSLLHWRRVLGFGSNRTIADIARQVGDQSANLVIGRMLGMAAAGLYSRGYGIVNMYGSTFVGAINGVAFPAFAREHRETGAAPQLFLRSLVYLTGISWPFFAAGILLAFPLIRVLFGSQWDAAVPLMRWLCAAAIVGTLTYQCNQFLVALGHVGAVTLIEVKYQLVRIGVTIVAAFYSVAAVAAVQVLVYVVATVLYYRRLRSYEPLSMGKCARALIPSMAVTMTTCIGPAVVASWPGLIQQHMIPALCGAVAAGCAGWLVGARIVRHPFLEEFRRAASRFPRCNRVLFG